MNQAAVDRARAEVERMLEKAGVTAADLENLTHRYRILGQAGVDVQRLGADDYKRYNLDPAHVRANKRLFDILKAARKLGANHPGSVISFQPNKLHA